MIPEQTRAMAIIEKNLLEIAMVTPYSLAEINSAFSAWLPMSGYSTIFGSALCRNLAMAGEPLPWEKQLQSFAEGIATGIRFDLDSDAILVAVERIAFRNNLERIFVPATVACWLAEHWPAWALPAVAAQRVSNRWRQWR